MVNSASNNGKLAYTFPGIQDLLTVSYDYLKSIDNIGFVLEVENAQGEILGCKDERKCGVDLKWD